MHSKVISTSLSYSIQNNFLNLTTLTNLSITKYIIDKIQQQQKGTDP